MVSYPVVRGRSEGLSVDDLEHFGNGLRARFHGGPAAAQGQHPPEILLPKGASPSLPRGRRESTYVLDMRNLLTIMGSLSFYGQPL